MKPDPTPERAAFARRVLAILRRLQPGLDAQVAEDSGMILVGDRRYGLQNLEARFRLAGSDDARLEAMVREHFERMARDDAELTGDLSWGEAKPLLMPQIMPETFLQHLPLPNQPFGPGLRVGIVIDAPRSYRYARADELKAWGVNFGQALGVALGNLDHRSHDLKVHAVLDEDRFLALQTGDSFDAARILLPRWQAFAGSHLGFPFRFGIPNRDFLICWSTGSRLQSQAGFSAKIAEDFHGQPYPLSALTFEMNLEGNIRPVS